MNGNRNDRVYWFSGNKEQPSSSSSQVNKSKKRKAKANSKPPVRSHHHSSKRQNKRRYDDRESSYSHYDGEYNSGGYGKRHLPNDGGYGRRRLPSDGGYSQRRLSSADGYGQRRLPSDCGYDNRSWGSNCIWNNVDWSEPKRPRYNDHHLYGCSTPVFQNQSNERDEIQDYGFHNNSRNHMQLFNGSQRAQENFHEDNFDYDALEMNYIGNIPQHVNNGSSGFTPMFDGNFEQNRGFECQFDRAPTSSWIKGSNNNFNLQPFIPNDNKNVRHEKPRAKKRGTRSLGVGVELFERKISNNLNMDLQQKVLKSKASTVEDMIKLYEDYKKCIDEENKRDMTVDLNESNRETLKQSLVEVNLDENHNSNANDEMKKNEGNAIDETDYLKIEQENEQNQIENVVEIEKEVLNTHELTDNNNNAILTVSNADKIDQKSPINEKLESEVSLKVSENSLVDSINFDSEIDNFFVIDQVGDFNVLPNTTVSFDDGMSPKPVVDDDGSHNKENKTILPNDNGSLSNENDAGHSIDNGSHNKAIESVFSNDHPSYNNHNSVLSNNSILTIQPLSPLTITITNELATKNTRKHKRTHLKYSDQRPSSNLDVFDVRINFNINDYVRTRKSKNLNSGTNEMSNNNHKDWSRYKQFGRTDRELVAVIDDHWNDKEALAFHNGWPSPFVNKTMIHLTKERKRVLEKCFEVVPTKVPKLLDGVPVNYLDVFNIQIGKNHVIQNQLEMSLLPSNNTKFKNTESYRDCANAIQKFYEPTMNLLENAKRETKRFYSHIQPSRLNMTRGEAYEIVRALNGVDDYSMFYHKDQ